MAVTITYYDASDWYGSFTDVTGVSWASGDFIVVAAGAEDWNDAEPAAPTNANLSFTQGHFDAVGTSGDCPGGMWYAQAGSAQTGQTIACNVGYNGGGDAAQGVWVVHATAGETLGFGQSDGNFTASALSLTVDADSVVLFALFDWNATSNNEDPATASGSSTERVDQGNETSWGQYLADWNGTSSGTYGFGPDTYSGLDPHQMAVEITVSGGALAVEPVGASVSVSAGSLTVTGGVQALSPTGPTVSVSAGSLSVSAGGQSYIDGESAFLTAHTDIDNFFTFDSTNANTGTDGTAATAPTGYDTSPPAGWPNACLDEKTEGPTSGDLDEFPITDAGMILYVPDGLASGTTYGLFHDGGGTNGQGGWLRNNSGTYQVAATTVVGGSSLDEAVYNLPSAGRWYCVSFQFHDNEGDDSGGAANIAVWVDGVEVATEPRTYALTNGSGNPEIGGNNTDEPSGWGGDNDIDGSGIRIAHYWASNGQGSSSAIAADSSTGGHGDDVHEDFYSTHVSAVSGQDITPTGPTVTVTAGTVTVVPDQPVTPTGPTVTVTAGTLTVVPDQPIAPTGPTVSVTAGTLTVVPSQPIDLTGPTVTVTAGSLEVEPGAVDVGPVGPTVSVSAGSLTVVEDQPISVTGPTVSVTPGVPSVVAGLSVSPTGPTVSVTAGTLEVEPGAVDVDPTGPTVSVTAGTLSVTQGLTVDPAGPTVTATPGTLTVAAGAVDLDPTGPTVTVTPGALTVATGAVGVEPAGPTVSVSAGSVTVTQGLAVVADGPTITVTAGTLGVVADQQLDVTGPTVTVTAGTLTVVEDQPVTPTGPTVTVTAGVPVFGLEVAPTAPTVTVTAGSFTLEYDQPVTPNGVTVTVSPGVLSMAGGVELVLSVVAASLPNRVVDATLGNYLVSATVPNEVP